MPSKDPAVKKRAQKRYRDSAHGKAHRKTNKAAWDRSTTGKASKNVSDKKWRQTTTYKAIMAQKARDRKKVRNTWFFDLKSKLKCEECGYDKHPAALQFHHKDRNDKIASVTQLLKANSASFDKVMAEIAKCAVLCANCHAVHHYKEYYDSLR